jgi:hypothetical protein
MLKTITVSTQAELLSALKTATGGETILMEGGDYGKLYLIDKSTFDLTFSSTVTLKAADANNPPVVTGLDMRNASHLSFDGVTFDYTANPGAAQWNIPFRVSGGNDISFNGCTFDGDLATGVSETSDGFPTGQGLGLGGITNVTVNNCEFFNFYKALAVGNCNNAVVTNNDIHDIRMDGMTFSNDQGVLIENNTIHNFNISKLSGDHADMIQFWTTGGYRPSTDITIRGNTLDIGDGGLTQSIFMRNELVQSGKAGAEMYYQNVLIEDNVIINGHLHGITVGETNGLTIVNNSVLHADGNEPDGRDSTVEIPRINVSPDSVNVTITHNATSNIVGYTGQAGWDVRMNAFVQDQDPNAPGWYDDIFATSSLTTEDGLHHLIALPGTMLTTLAAGATSILNQPTDHLTAAFNVTGKENDLHSLTFDAAATLGPKPAGTTYVWTFGDGTTATGKTVTHSYADGGVYDVKLTVKLPSGLSDVAAIKIGVEDSLVARLGDKGGFILGSHGTETLIKTAMPLDSGYNLQLGGKGAVTQISHSALERIFGQDDVTIDFRLRTDTPSSTGEIFRLHGSLQATVRSNGVVEMKVWNADGSATCVTSGTVAINDGKFHNVTVDIDNGKLALLVDGVKTQEVAFTGSIVDPGNFDLTFGSGWSGKNLVGDLDTFQIKVVDETPTHSAPSTAPVVDKIDIPAPVISAPSAPVVEPARETLLHLTSDGNFATTVDGVTKIITVDKAMISNGDLQLSSALKSVAQVDDALFDQMFHSKDVEIGFRVSADTAGETGEIFRIHGSVLATITSKGELQVKVYNEDGSASRVTSTGLKINDGAFHDVDVKLVNGHLSLWVDDHKIDDASFIGAIKDAGNYDLTFGSSWTSNNFGGDLDTFHISIAADPLSHSALSADAPLV